MNSLLSFLEQEAPDKRVLEWLKQCSAAPKDERYCRVNCEGPENDSDESELTSDVHLIKGIDVLNVQHSTEIQNESFSTNRNKQLKDKHRKSSETDSGCLTSSTALRLYSREENLNIVRYIVENDAFPFLKGTLLWRKMENEKVCYRSWQSMKAQFNKKIYLNIGEYPLEREDKEKFMQYMKPSPAHRIIHMEPGKRGWRKNGRYYTIEEDLIILKYIFHRQRHHQVHGNCMWQTMEERQILPGRTWQSMRSRYLNVIRYSLDVYKIKDSGLELLMNSKEHGLRSKKKNKGVHSPVSCTNTKNLVGKKVANQDIRKYAISTGIQLASKLKLFEKNTGLLKNPNKEVQQKNCSLVHRAVSDTETPAIDKQSTSERIEENPVNRKEVECSITCNISSIVPNLEKDDASTNKSVDESDNANKKSDKNDSSVENSGSDSPICASTPRVNQKETLKETHTFVENISSRNSESNCNEGRNNVDCAAPDQVSDVQKSFDSVSECCDMRTPCTENHTRSGGKVLDNETQNVISDLEGSFSSQKSLVTNLCDVHRSIKNCVKCSSAHKLSPSSN